MHEQCRCHAASHWHKEAVEDATNFLKSKPVDVLLITGHQKLVEENRKVIASIITVITFCGAHVLALRGKDQHEGVFQDLINFRIEAEDEHLAVHTEVAKQNAT